MKGSKIHKILQKANISFSKHSRQRLKERYGINRPQALLDILSVDADISELEIYGRIQIISNGRVYILSRQFIVITVK